MAQGSGRLPPGTVHGALGLNTLSFKEHDYVCRFSQPLYIILLRDPKISVFTQKSLFFSKSKTSSLLKTATLLKLIRFTMAAMAGPMVDELVEENENFSLDDFSIQVIPDDNMAKDTIARTVVGRFVGKRGVAMGTMRRALSGMWRLSSRWRLQEPLPKTYICRLNTPKEAKFVLDNGPWNPCNGFLLVAALPEDGNWRNANLNTVDIWVKAFGVPMPFMTEECVSNMAKRMGTLLQSNKVRRNGIILNHYLRFQVRLNISSPLLAGVSLTDEREKKWWCHFKYERLPLFYFKCGAIGHDEEGCSGRKRTVTVQDGRTIPLYGSWLREGSKLDNGFALLEVEDINDIRRLEKEDPAGISIGAVSEKVNGAGESGLGGEKPTVGNTLVEREGMEGVVSQKSDNSFSVAYNDYVDLSKFPSKHVLQVANIFKEKLGPIKFGATGDDSGSNGGKSVQVQKLKKPKLIGPKGVPKPPVFGQRSEMGNLSGSKRKKTTRFGPRSNEFVAESQGPCCLLGVDKTGVNDAFGEASGVHSKNKSNGDSGSGDSGKRHRIDMAGLRSKEGSFSFLEHQAGGERCDIRPSGEEGVVGNPVLVPPGLGTLSNPLVLVPSGGVALSNISDARTPGALQDFTVAEEAGLIMPPNAS
uniref:Zinc knuckle CX2CX4HX4C domain-containing protein n=1 Tax=Cannabis sativa TaxID=3483 RepID=A0A803Q9C8_CANSA